MSGVTPLPVRSGDQVDPLLPVRGTEVDPTPSAQPREYLQRLPTPVTVVAAGEYGMTASAVLQVSDEPPIVMVALMARSHGLGAIRRFRRFTVNVVGAEHEQVTTHFASRGRPRTERFIVGEWEDSTHGPRLVDAVLHLSCLLHAIQSMGDHTLVFGRVEAIAARDADPVVRVDRRIRGLG